MRSYKLRDAAMILLYNDFIDAVASQIKERIRLYVINMIKQRHIYFEAQREGEIIRHMWRHAESEHPFEDYVDDYIFESWDEPCVDAEEMAYNYNLNLDWFDSELDSIIRIKYEERQKEYQSSKSSSE